MNQKVGRKKLGGQNGRRTELNDRVGKKNLQDAKENPELYNGRARPAIPEAIAREVRQRCGFGCVVCGFPLYEYEHMNEWARVKEHVASDMTLLCDQHHREKTNGLLGIDQVRECDAHPHNLKGESTPYNFHAQKAGILIRVGNNRAVFDTDKGNIFTVLSIANKPVLWFKYENGYILLSLTVYDRKNVAIVKIRDNELVYSTEPWDITFKGTTLSIRSAAGQFILVLTVAPNEKLIDIKRAALRYDGIDVAIDEKSGLQMPGNGISGCILEGVGHFINVGGVRSPGAINFAGKKTW